MERKPNESITKQGISDQRWVSHFKSVFQARDSTPLPGNPSATGLLDGDISDEEIQIAAYILQNGKSAGFDNISNEMLKCLLEARPDILKTVFNSILRNPSVIECWSMSIISPIHKAGSKK